MKNIKLIAFDLDGTLTQHKTQLDPINKQALTDLDKRYKLLMVGAGDSMRIFKQMNCFPIDIIGNYGMQTGLYNKEKNSLDLSNENPVSCNRNDINERAMKVREKYNLFNYEGDSVEFHESGVLTLAILGTKARAQDKLAYDPNRAKRKVMYGYVKDLFPEYNVFIGGSSSFDMAPKPYDKQYALNQYCLKHGISHDEVVYFGDDYGPGGNDESIYLSDISFVKIDDYRTFPEKANIYLK